MRTTLFIILSLFFFLENLYTQAPDTLWTKTFALPGCALWAVELQKTFDNGYIIFGESYYFDTNYQ